MKDRAAKQFDHLVQRAVGEAYYPLPPKRGSGKAPNTPTEKAIMHRAVALLGDMMNSADTLDEYSDMLGFEGDLRFVLKEISSDLQEALQAAQNKLADHPV